MKGFLRAALVTAALFAVFTLSAHAETVKGGIKYDYKGSTIVDNDWTFDTETGVLTITSRTNGYNETGTGQDDYKKYGAWSDYNDKIKKVVLEGRFSKISNNAFRGCKNLTEVAMTNTVNQIDGYAFDDCEALETIYVQQYGRFEGMADLRNVTWINKHILTGTAIKTLRLSAKACSHEGEDVLPSKDDLPSGITAIYGDADGNAKKFAEANGLAFEAREDSVTVTILDTSGNIYEYRALIDGMCLSQGTGRAGEAVLLFTDKECKNLFDYDTNIYRDTTLYALPVLEFTGFEAADGEKSALRAIFSFSGLDRSEITEVGVIAGLSEYALDDFTEEKASHKIKIYEDGFKIGKTLGVPNGGTQSFAASAVGYEKDAERGAKNVVFRGYIRFRTASGKVLTVFTSAVGTTLDFVSGKAPTGDVRYTKDELLNVLTDIYNDNGKLMVGEEINVGAYASDVRGFYKKESGEEPSIIGMDLACYGAQLMDASDEYKLKFTKSVIDYVRAGGVVTASSHFANPLGGAGGSCRGTLGLDDMWERLITDGDELNAFFKEELTVDAKFLRDLMDNDVPILWRPFHEMNGGWFWFCVKQGDGIIDSRTFWDVWEYVYNYYVNELGLKNLVWVYSPNNDTGSLVDVDYAYPGDEYVDMTGLDWYTSGNFEIDSGSDAYFVMMDHRKPTALTEYGASGGKLDSIASYNDFHKMYDMGMKLTYVLTWTTENSFPKAGRLNELMQKPDILSLEDMKQIFTGLRGK